MANHWQQLNGRQRAFVKLYNGDSKIAGNATRCYMAAYDQANQLCAQRAGSRLLKNPHVKALLARAEERATERLEIDATFVKSESLRLYKRAMGDDPIQHVEIDTDPDTGLERISVREQRSYDPTTARAALQLIGQHKDVQAFIQTVEHNHTHHLEQRLAARSKAIEGKAQVIDDPGQVQQLQHDPAQVPDVDADTMAAEAHTTAGEQAHTELAEQGEKRVHPRGGQEERAHAQEKTSSERAGATAE